MQSRPNAIYQTRKKLLGSLSSERTSLGRGSCLTIQPYPACILTLKLIDAKQWKIHNVGLCISQFQVS